MIIMIICINLQWRPIFIILHSFGWGVGIHWKTYKLEHRFVEPEKHKYEQAKRCIGLPRESRIDIITRIRTVKHFPEWIFLVHTYRRIRASKVEQLCLVRTKPVKQLLSLFLFLSILFCRMTFLLFNFRCLVNNTRFYGNLL